MRRLSHPGVAFLDRDGTINEKAPEGDYIKRPAEVALLPGAAEAVRRLDARQLKIASVELHQPTLDDVFLTLTGHAPEPEGGDETGSLPVPAATTAVPEEARR